MGREIKRVALDFEHPLGEVWQGFLQPDEMEEKACPDCQIGYSPHAQNLYDLWYGHLPFHPAMTGCLPLTWESPGVRAFAERNVGHAPDFYGSDDHAVQREGERLAKLWNGQWCHHLTQADVNALVKGNRLMDFTHTWSRGAGWVKKDPPYKPTAVEVNEWSLSGFSHDSINASVVVEARCKKDGFDSRCATCEGHGSIEAYPGQRAEAEAWKHTDPPAGNGWQVWETVSEGSPITPVFPTAEALINHLSTVGTLWDQNRGDGPWRREAAESFVNSGWAPSAMAVGGELMMGGRDADRMDALLGAESRGGDG